MIMTNRGSGWSIPAADTRLRDLRPLSAAAPMPSGIEMAGQRHVCANSSVYIYDNSIGSTGVGPTPFGVDTATAANQAAPPRGLLC